MAVRKDYNKINNYLYLKLSYNTYGRQTEVWTYRCILKNKMCHHFFGYFISYENIVVECVCFKISFSNYNV